MRVFTPTEIARQAGNKYVGVLVAAKFARFVNDFPRDRSYQYEKKLTTTAFEELARGGLTYKITRRRRQEA
jgi:DNA-directed RNA polymerase subunit K/omega